MAITSPEHNGFKESFDMLPCAVKGTFLIAVCGYISHLGIPQEHFKPISTSIKNLAKSYISQDLYSDGDFFKLTYGVPANDSSHEILLLQSWKLYKQPRSLDKTSVSSIVKDKSFYAGQYDEDCMLPFICSLIIEELAHSVEMQPESRVFVVNSLQEYTKSFMKDPTLPYRPADSTTISLLCAWKCYAECSIANFDSWGLTKKFDNLRDEGNKLMKAKSYAKAIAVYTEALSIKRSHLLLSNRSAAYSALRCCIEAEMDAREAISLNPGFTVGWTRLAYIDLLNGNALGSISCYVRAIQTTFGKVLPPHMKTSGKEETKKYVEQMRLACLPEFRTKLVESMYLAESRARQQGHPESLIKSKSEPIRNILAQYAPNITHRPGSSLNHQQQQQHQQQNNQRQPQQETSQNPNLNISNPSSNNAHANPAQSNEILLNPSISANGISPDQGTGTNNESSPANNVDSRSIQVHAPAIPAIPQPEEANITTMGQLSTLLINNVSNALFNSGANVNGAFPNILQAGNNQNNPINAEQILQSILESISEMNANTGGIDNSNNIPASAGDSVIGYVGAGNVENEMDDPDIDIDDVTESGDPVAQPDIPPQANIHPIFSQFANALPDSVRDALTPFLNQQGNGTNNFSIAITSNGTTTTTTTNHNGDQSTTHIADGNNPNSESYEEHNDSDHSIDLD